MYQVAVVAVQLCMSHDCAAWVTRYMYNIQLYGDDLGGRGGNDPLPLFPNKALNVGKRSIVI